MAGFFIAVDLHAKDNYLKVLTLQMRIIIINSMLANYPNFVIILVNKLFIQSFINWKGAVMSKQMIISQARFVDNEECKVLYNKAKDMVELEVGGTSLRFEAGNFFMMNEMMRKAAAKLIMQTELRHTNLT